jgi:hypothetical protein
MKINSIILLCICVFLVSCREPDGVVVDSKEYTIYYKEESISKAWGNNEYWIRDRSRDGAFRWFSDAEYEVGDVLEFKLKSSVPLENE